MKTNNKQYKHVGSLTFVCNGQILQWDPISKINILRSRDKKYVYTQLKCSKEVCQV